MTLTTAASGQTMHWQDYEQPGYQATQRAMYAAAELALTNRLEQLNAQGQVSDATILSYLQKLVSVCATQGKYQDALDYCKLAIRFSEREANNLAGTAMLYVGMGNCSVKLKKLSEADLYYKKAEDLLARSPQCGANERARLLSGQAEVASAKGKFEVATKLFESAIQLEKSTGSGASPADLTRYANCLQLQGKISESRSVLEEALKLDTQQLGADHPALAANLNNLAVLDARTEDFQAAEKEMSEALAIGRQWKYGDLPDWIDNMAFVLEKAAKHDDASKLRQESLAMRTKRIPKVFTSPTEEAAVPGISDRTGTAGLLRAF